MTTLPALTGKQLVAALARVGFDVQRIKGSLIFFAIPMDGPRWCRYTAVKRSVPACSPRFSGTAN